MKMVMEIDLLFEKRVDGLHEAIYKIQRVAGHDEYYLVCALSDVRTIYRH